MHLPHLHKHTDTHPESHEATPTSTQPNGNSVTGKKVVFNKTGDSSVLEYVDFEFPAPGSNEVRVKVEAIGLNFIDIYFRTGLYKVPSFPAGLSTEGAGVIESVGPNVTDFKPGDRVAYCLGPQGAYAEWYLCPAAKLIRLPKNISFEVAAAGLLKGLTVQYLFRQTYELKKDDVILFHAAAGGVGLIAVQWAKALGVKLIGTTSSHHKAHVAKEKGAWEIINYKHENIVERVKELTDGKKLKVVYDSVGKDTWETSLDSLAPRGLLVSFGNASGAVTGVNLGILASKGSLYVTRPTLGSYATDQKIAQAMADELFDLISSGKIEIEINQRYSLKNVAAAQDNLQSGKTIGSTVLYPEELAYNYEVV